jgi:hypothetical protein
MPAPGRQLAGADSSVYVFASAGGAVQPHDWNMVGGAEILREPFAIKLRNTVIVGLHHLLTLCIWGGQWVRDMSPCKRRAITGRDGQSLRKPVH